MTDMPYGLIEFDSYPFGRHSVPSRCVPVFASTHKFSGRERVFEDPVSGLQFGMPLPFIQEPRDDTG
jgi:hypothetical protein